MMTRARSGLRDTRTSSDFIPEFFKIFLPKFSADQLRIPRAFIHQCKRTIPEKLVLIDQGGKLWDVDVNETADGVFMTNGWKRFVKDHALNPGDFLVFRYDEKFSFTVKIFGINGCKKEVVETENIDTCIKIEEDIEEQTQVEQNCQERAHNVDPNYAEQSQRRPNRLSGLQKAKQSKLLRRFPRVDKTRRNYKTTGLSEQGAPYFIAPITSFHQLEMYIPKNMDKRYNVKFKPEMMLCSNTGRWPVLIHQRKDGRLAFGRGWMAFWKKNKLSVGDRCQFMFDTKGSGKVEVQVLPSAACKRLRRS